MRSKQETHNRSIGAQKTLRSFSCGKAGRSATVESLPREEGGGFGLINFDAVEGDVLQLNPQEGWKGKGGTVVQMEKQVGRWVEDRRANW